MHWANLMHVAPSRPRTRRMGMRAFLSALVFLVLALGAGLSASERIVQQVPNPALANAPSPYLRHHASDAVRWRPWGRAAFEEAKGRNVPVFLSVGYLACYWCDVMQRENYRDPEVAKLLNEHFVPVLVDREAQADVDELYMAVSAALRGVAGWPNHVFLTPELEPFHAEGYLPRERFIRLLEQVAARWRENPRELRASARKIAQAVREYLQRQGRAKAALESLTRERFLRIVHMLAARFDPFHGGLDGTPKHFRQPLLMLLARAALAHHDLSARTALLNTLRHVTRGSVYDHLEGGFFRYATDAAWHIPHFEKMLYDQALMADALRAGWRLSGDIRLKRRALETLDFALAQLRLANGAFAASLGAHTPDGREGGRFLFTPEELRALLGAEDAKWAEAKFGIVTEGALTGHVVAHSQDVALENPAERQRLQRVLATLRKALVSRPRHARDEKAITGWNGLMIGALARAALQWDRADHGEAAARAAHLILRRLRTSDGLARYWLRGAAHGRATLQDYAYLIDALLALHDWRSDADWLEQAKRLAREATQRFLDERSGRWWFASARTGFARLPPPADRTLPAADAVMALNLLRLAARTGEDEWRVLAEGTLSSVLAKALEKPLAHVSALRAADIFLRGDDTPVQYAANSHLRAFARWVDVAERRFAVRVRIAEGWHVQAPEPDDENLIPTRLELLRPKGALLAEVRYPKPITRALAFSGKPLKLLEGAFDITGRVTLPTRMRVPVVLRLQVQACDDETCLAPEWLGLYLPPPETARSGP